MKDEKSSNGEQLTYTMLVRLPDGHFEDQAMLEIFPHLTAAEIQMLKYGSIGTKAHLNVPTGDFIGERGISIIDGNAWHRSALLNYSKIG